MQNFQLSFLFLSSTFVVARSFSVTEFNGRNDLRFRLFYEHQSIVQWSNVDARTNWIHVENARVRHQLECFLRSIFSFFSHRNGLFYYRAHRVKLRDADVFWKRSPQDFCQGSARFFFQLIKFRNCFFLLGSDLDNRTRLNYTTQFLGVQYFLDLSIIEYITDIALGPSSVKTSTMFRFDFLLFVFSDSFETFRLSWSLFGSVTYWF